MFDSSHSRDLDWIVHLYAHHGDDLQRIDRSLKLFESVIYDKEIKPGRNLSTTLVNFVAVTNDIEQAAAVISILARSEDTYYSLDELLPAFSFGTDPDEIAGIIQALNRAEDYTYQAAVSALVSQKPNPFLRSAIARRILADDQKTLKRMASIHQLLIALGGKSPQLDSVPETGTDWMSVYPRALHTELARLAQQTSRAEAIGRETLGKDIPDPRRLQKEIDSILAKIGDCLDGAESAKQSHLQQRVANLEQRRDQPANVSSARMATLIAKLSNRVDHESIERFVQACRKGVAEIISDRYQMDRVPDELLAPPLDAVLADILALSKPMRQLGLRLVFETLNRSTRRFDIEPANDAFCSGLVAKGINMDVWVGDTFETFSKTASGVPYRLSFTRDVMDFLLMGFHFDTCLSPGDCNFFSTVTNAVDINKRVVYGKTESGNIIGRCLFALNDDGHILTYHRYAHDSDDKFAESVDHFATELASAMNSRLTDRGTVASLVAKEWYDDGANGIGDSETITDAIRKLMTDAEPSSLCVKLTDLLSRDEICSRIDELTSMDELANRPDALRGFLTGLAQDDALTPLQRFVVARVAYRHAQSDVTLELLAQVPPKRVIEIIRRTQCDYCSVFHGVGSYRDVFDMMVAFNPTIAIRVMRASRGKRSRDDLLDGNPVRRKALARAHKTLGRIQIAQQLARV